ncbi:MAG: tyrosine-type recombinase/integrase [Erysipelotrichaceae bacterium]|nr:tyrosine-type recombinase/integrase [Erysipelotrichaceae bacterium]
MSKPIMLIETTELSDETKSNDYWSLNEAMKYLFQYCEVKNLRKLTIDNYRKQLKEFELFIKNNRKYETVNEIRQYDINEYTLHLKNKGLKDESVNSYLRGLRVLVNYCMDNEQCGRLKVHIGKADKQIKPTYTDDELTALLVKPNLRKCSFSEYRNWVTVNFFLGTGVRVATLINAKIEDVDLIAERFTIRHSKNRKSSIIPISKQLKSVLLEYLRIRKGDEDDYLFCNQFGEQMTIYSLRHAIERYNKARGVSKTGLHTFRHTYAKKCVLNGVNVFVLQRLMGHSDISVTKEYVNLYAEDLSRDIELYNPLDTLNKENIKKAENYIKEKIKIKIV